MSTVLINEASLENIADAIRAKNKTQTTYKPAQMADAISAIETKRPYQLGGYHKESTWSLEVNGNHVKFQSIGSFAAGSIGLRNIGLGNDYLNCPTWISVPSGSEVEIKITNVVNSGSISWAMNTKVANTTTSGSYGTGNGTHSDGVTINRTTTDLENWGCLFIYLGSSTDSVLEFDISVTIDGGVII